MFDQDVKERIRAAVDIGELIGNYLELRQQGRGYVALCPWHDDTKPSLQVNCERQSWKCWVCDLGGDVYSFVQQYEGVGFRQALEMLADRAHIELPKHRRAPATKPGDPNDKATLYKAAAWAEEQFHQALLRSDAAEPARRYLSERRVNQESIERHRLGFAPLSWDFLARMGPANGFSLPVLEAVDLVVKRANSPGFYDRFRGRLIFPIRDIESRPIAFGGRVIPELDDQNSAKYLNSKETRLFSKSENLYGLDLVRQAVRKHHHLVIMEGYTDVVASMQAGMDNVVAVLGTALGERHLRLFRRLFAERLTLVLDGDDAGQRRANEVLELLVSQQADLRVATLPNGQDPADYVMEHGVEAFREFLAAAPDALDHKLRCAARDLQDSGNSLHQTNRALEDILRLLAAAPTGEQQTGAGRLRVEQVLSRLSREFQVNEEQLRERMGEIRQSGRSIRHEQRLAQAPEIKKRESLSARDSELLQILIQNPTLVPIAREAFGVSDMESESARILYQTCLTLHQAGVLPDFDRLMTTMDDPQHKSLLVELDELATQKAEQTSDSAEARLDQLIQRYVTRQTWTENHLKVSELERKQADQTEELDVLQQCLALQRKRQGIVDPTDG